MTKKSTSSTRKLKTAILKAVKRRKKGQQLTAKERQLCDIYDQAEENLNTQ